MDNVLQLPEEDTYREGEVLRWGTAGGTSRVAIKQYNGTWLITGYTQASTWDTVITLARDHSDFFGVATSWKSQKVKNPPRIDVSGTEAQEEDLVLLDTAAQIAWVRQGDEWVRDDDWEW